MGLVAVLSIGVEEVQIRRYVAGESYVDQVCRYDVIYVIWSTILAK